MRSGRWSRSVVPVSNCDHQHATDRHVRQDLPAGPEGQERGTRYGEVCLVSLTRRRRARCLRAFIGRTGIYTDPPLVEELVVLAWNY